MSWGYAVGIDFGTTNSVVAQGTVATAGVVSEVAEDPVMPSVVSFTEEGAFVGREAVNRAVTDPERTVLSAKRRLGDDGPIVEGADGTEYTAEQVAALVLSKLKQRAQTALNAPVTNAVVTVPAFFGYDRRDSIRRAAEMAGLSVDRLISEPAAACLSYGVGSAEDGAAESVLVYDLGGGTFDVSLVDISEGVFDVVASRGDTRLGGNDWDERLVEFLHKRLDEEGIAVDDPVTDARLRRTAKKVRHDLTDRTSTTVALPFIEDSENVEIEVTREDLDECTGDLAERTTNLCEAVLEDAEWNPWTLDRVLLVGGATRMPQIRETVFDYFGQVPSVEVDPDVVVSTGAAIQASILHDDPTTAERGWADGGTATETDTGSTRGPNAVMVDVVPRTMGVETSVEGEGGFFSPILERNISLPAERTRRYRTSRDNQTAVTVRVYQGDAEYVDDNEFLGSFTLSGLPKAPSGEVGIEVSFEVDENGTLDVRAVGEGTAESADVTIESAFGPAGEIRRAREELPVIR